jgi:hypothetical protein
MGHRARAAVLALAVVLLAVVPTWIVSTVGRVSGTPRVQDGWAAAVWPETDGARPALHEAWSVSFRKDPPGLAPPPAPAAGTRALARAIGALGLRDPRVLALLALAVVAILIARAGPHETALARLASSVVLPPAILGVVFGSGSLVMLAMILVAALVAARFARITPASAIAGAAVLAAGAAIVVTSSSLGPGLGLGNLRLYAGAEPGRGDLAGPALVVAGAVLALVWARRATLEASRVLGGAAAFLMAALWLAPSASPNDVLGPIALLAIAATCDERDSFDTPRAPL